MLYKMGILLIYLYIRILLMLQCQFFFLSKIFVFNFDLMKSVMSFTAEMMIFVGVLLS